MTCDLQGFGTQTFFQNAFDNCKWLYICILCERHAKWQKLLGEEVRQLFMHLTWRKRSKGRDNEGVPESSTARLALLQAATTASVWRESGAVAVVRRV